jgi:hypothetical protein
MFLDTNSYALLSRSNALLYQSSRSTFVPARPTIGVERIIDRQLVLQLFVIIDINQPKAFSNGLES